MNLRKIILLMGFVLSCLAVHAQWGQLGNDIDGEAIGDQFGWKVSLSDNGVIMASSAVYNDAAGNNAGNVRIFENTNGAWVQVGQSINGTAAGDGFGRGMSLNADGSIIAIGAPFYDNWAGQVQVYENQNGVWSQIGQDIEAGDSGEFFGNSISLSDDGNILAVGAIYNSDNGPFSGQVRIFKNINGNWVQIGSNLSGDAEDDFFGYAVSLSSNGSILAISAPINTGNGTPNMAYTRIYQNTGGTWVQMGQDIDGDVLGDQKGSAISISADGAVLAVGAPSADGGNGDHSGAVSIYEYINGDWEQVWQSIPGEAEWDFFGEAVSLSADGTLVAVGASASDDNGSESGHVRVFKRTNDTWIQIGPNVVGEAAGDRFGGSISLSADGTELAVGAVVNAGNGELAGQVRVFSGIINGVEEYSSMDSKISVFPNPTQGMVSIQSISSHLGEVSVLDVTGRLILLKKYSGNETEGSIDFSAFENGVYFIRVLDGKFFHTVKIIKT